jgi:ATP adenylyltransferase
VVNHRIWAPDRFKYVKDASKDIEEECIFCVKQAEDDDEANLIVHRGQRAFVILNLYPYTNGHLKVYDPHGFNVGLNQGRAAGAGVEHHIHLHVVPRWGGDTNFMPVIADTKVMPQTLEQSYEALKGSFD